MNVGREGAGRSRAGGERRAGLFWILRYMDFALLFAGIGLSAFGVFAMYLLDSGGGYSYATNQLWGFLGGAVVALVLTMLDYRRLRQYVWWLYAAGWSL